MSGPAVVSTTPSVSITGSGFGSSTSMVLASISGFSVVILGSSSGVGFVVGVGSGT